MGYLHLQRQQALIDARIQLQKKQLEMNRLEAMIDAAPVPGAMETTDNMEGDHSQRTSMSGNGGAAAANDDLNTSLAL